LASSSPNGKPYKSVLARLLLALARGGTVEEAAREAGLSVEEAVILVSSLVSEGYLRSLDSVTQAAACPCRTCPFRYICGGRRGPGAYVLTDKGRRLLASLLPRGGRGGAAGRPR
jgi:hypothetical protein